MAVSQKQLSTLPDSELISILEDTENYSSQTLVAVKEQLFLRNALPLEYQPKGNQAASSATAETEASTNQATTQKVSKTKRSTHSSDGIISTLIIGTTVIAMISMSAAIMYIMAAKVQQFGFLTIEIILQPIALFLATGLMKQKKRLGWFILCAAYSYHVTLAAISVATPTESDISPISAIPFISAITAVEVFFLVLFSGALYLLNKQKLMNSFGVASSTRWSLILSTSIATLVWVLVIR